MAQDRIRAVGVVAESMFLRRMMKRMYRRFCPLHSRITLTLLEGCLQYSVLIVTAGEARAGSGAETDFAHDNSRNYAGARCG